jgi:hypothetical protein
VLRERNVRVLPLSMGLRTPPPLPTPSNHCGLPRECMGEKTSREGGGAYSGWLSLIDNASSAAWGVTAGLYCSDCTKGDNFPLSSPPGLYLCLCGRQA